MSRTFETTEARRCRVPLLIGIVSPSGAGKTYSALRLATGIQRVTGGSIEVVDTEARRSLHYADKFKFNHTPFGAPFSPLDYLDAIEHCVKRGAKTIVLDSCSHEHEGPGGVLEMHDEETTRLASEWKTSREKVQMTAWSKPKADRRRLINTMLQIDCNFILCFRAKEKLKIIPGKQPENQGFVAIGGEEWIYEMTMNALLHPCASGVPTWAPEQPGERNMVKLPSQFRELFLERYADQPLCEDVGQALAVWAAGDAAAATDADYENALKAIAGAASKAVLRKLATELRSKVWGDDQRGRISSAIEHKNASFAEGKAA
jgi:AAA domain